MRDQSDLITVHVATVRDLTVDLEMLEANPRFRSIFESLAAQHPEAAIETPRAIEALAVRDYLMNYVSTDEFPHQTPGTTGPGNVTQVQVEVVLNDACESKDGAH